MSDEWEDIAAPAVKTPADIRIGMIMGGRSAKARMRVILRYHVLSQLYPGLGVEGHKAKAQWSKDRKKLRVIPDPDGVYMIRAITTGRGEKRTGAAVSYALTIRHEDWLPNCPIEAVEPEYTIGGTDMIIVLPAWAWDEVERQRAERHASLPSPEPVRRQEAQTPRLMAQPASTPVREPARPLPGRTPPFPIEAARLSITNTNRLLGDPPPGRREAIRNLGKDDKK